jgi:hypothetical protein
MKYFVLLALLVGGCVAEPPSVYESVYPAYDGDPQSVYDVPQTPSQSSKQ